MNTKLEIIEEGITKSPRRLSTLTYEMVAKMSVGEKEATIKVIVESNSYRFQCKARVLAFSKETQKWENVNSIPYSAMKTKDKLYYMFRSNEEPDITSKRYFAEDIKTMLERAEQIIF